MDQTKLELSTELKNIIDELQEKMEEFQDNQNEILELEKVIGGKTEKELKEKLKKLEEIKELEYDIDSLENEKEDLQVIEQDLENQLKENTKDLEINMIEISKVMIKKEKLKNNMILTYTYMPDFHEIDEIEDILETIEELKMNKECIATLKHKIQELTDIYNQKNKIYKTMEN
jgi:hypothetical protein